MDGQRTPEGGRVKRPRRPKIILEQLALFTKLLSGRNRGKSTAAGCAILSACLIAFVPASASALDAISPYCTVLAPSATFNYSWLDGTHAEELYHAGKQMSVTYNTTDSTWEVHVMQGVTDAVDIDVGRGNLGDKLTNLDTEAEPTATDYVAMAFAADGSVMSTGDDPTGAMGPGFNYQMRHDITPDWCIYMLHGVTLSSGWISHHGAVPVTTASAWESSDPGGGGGDGGGTETPPPVPPVVFTDTAARELAAYIHNLALKGAAFCITLAICWFLVKPFIWRYLE